MDVASLLPDASTLTQGGVLLAWALLLLRVIYQERAEHRTQLEQERAEHRRDLDDVRTELADARRRIRELEQLIRDRLTQHEAEVDAERARRRAAEDRCVAQDHRHGMHALEAIDE